MVAWTLPSAGGGDLRLEAAPRGDGLDLEVTGPEAGGDVRVKVVSPDQTSTADQLHPAGPGRWQGDVPVGSLGTYLVHAVLERSGSVVAQSEVAVPVPYSPEYLELGRDDGLLGTLARQGGSLLDRPERAWSLPTLRIGGRSPVFWLLLLLVVVAWPVDVALRRLTLGPGELVSALRESRDRRRDHEPAVPASLSRIRAGVDQARVAQADGPAGERASPVTVMDPPLTDDDRKGKDEQRG
jgi:hypothetical protein